MKANSNVSVHTPLRLATRLLCRAGPHAQTVPAGRAVQRMLLRHNLQLSTTHTRCTGLTLCNLRLRTWLCGFCALPTGLQLQVLPVDVTPHTPGQAVAWVGDIANEIVSSRVALC